MSSSQLLRRKRKHVRSRSLQLEQLEARYALDAALAADFFELRQNGAQIALDVLANDTFTPDYTGAREISSVSYGSEGGRLEISADRKQVLYTPPADFFGSEAFVYAVDGQHTAEVRVNLQSPLAFDQYEIPPDGQERVLDVLANDPFWSGYTGAKKITSVSVGSEGGLIAIGPDGKSIRYTPPEEGFGRETFIYVVDDLYPAQVTVDVPTTLHADVYDLLQHAPPKQMFVLDNDPFWVGYTGEKRITAVADVAEGTTVEIASDGKSLVYSVTSGATADTQFRYIVDGAYEAKVTVYVYRPVQDDQFTVDRNSVDFFFNVTENDQYYDRHNQWHDVIDRVTSVTQSANGGTVSISADGKGILYTPAANFSGADTFTYTADGVHVATVTVNVTRPVRDDNITNSAIQDTANRTLDVLANDFVGNGYTGAKIITSVGVTQNGGTITIRADGKAILYTPAPGYVGSDEFTYTVDGELEATVNVNVRSLANADGYSFKPDPPQGTYLLNVMANDLFHLGYAGSRQITTAELTSGSGTVSIQNGNSLRLNVPAAGSYSIRYVVDGKYETTAWVNISTALSSDKFTIDENSGPQAFAVLINDFEYYQYSYSGPRKITAVTQSEHGGSVTFDATTGTVNYTPALDFYGTDSFTYTVDNFMSTTVSVNVIRRVRDDHFRVDAADGTQPLPVLVNDLFGANYSGVGRITSVTTTSNGGTATISADGKSILYTPAAGFVGTETFTYKVDGRLTAEVSVVVDTPRGDHLPKFASSEEYAQFLLEGALARYQYLFGQPGWGYINFYSTDTAGAPTSGRDHSETNVQVAGVDEGDIVEFDSDYVYTLNGDEVVIVNAWPAEEMFVSSRVDIEGRPIAMFLKGDRLTVISETGGGYDWNGWYGTIDDSVFRASDVATDSLWWPGPQLPSTTIVTVIDVSNRAAPEIVQKTEMEGKYVDSRGVGEFVYVLVDNFSAVASQPLIVDHDNDPQTLGRYETRDEYIARIMANIGEFVEAALPSYTSYDGDNELVRTGLLNGPEDVYKPLVANANNLISVVSFNVLSDEPGLADTSAVYSTGASAIYASLDNFYVFDSDYSSEDGPLTRIAKFDWDPSTGGIDFAATTTVAGTIINQFSADEHDGYLRIATTMSNGNAGNWSGRSENTLFVLQEDDGVFEFVGSLQNLALNETMRSVRFMGDRAFVTTARTIDPLFAIDLSDATRPEAVGHITLPGFTSYVHFIGDNYLLTVGRNSPNGQSGPTQVSIFDVSNMAQPLRIAEYTFERFSFSESEVDHHAFGYFAAHGLLAIPTVRGYYERVDADGDGYRETRQYIVENELVVFSVDVAAADPNQRLKLETEIAHDSPVRRSGYIGDKLYSIANDSVKVVDVTNLDEVLASVDVSPEPNLVDPVPYPIPILRGNYYLDFTGLSQPATSTPVPEPIDIAIQNARKHLAARLGKADGAPLLVTAEAAPGTPGGGWCLVFRVGETEYLYRASEAGHVQLVDETFEFGGGGAWNAVDFTPSQSLAGMAGDFDFDGCVDNADLAAWRSSFGAVSLVSRHAADANRDGVVGAADYTVWRANLGRVAGDFNADGVVDRGDLEFWKANFGATAGPGLAADGNGDGVVDAADFSAWRDAFREPIANQAVMEPAAASFAAPMSALAIFEELPAEEHATSSEVHRPALRSSATPLVRSLMVSAATSRSEGAAGVSVPSVDFTAVRGNLRADYKLLAFNERSARRLAQASAPAVDEALGSLAATDEFGEDCFAFAAMAEELELAVAR